MADNKALIREFVDVIFNQHQLDRAEEFFTPDFVDHNPWPGYAATIQGFKDGTADFFAGFPDARVEIDEILEAGDRLIVRNRLVGTNSGSFMGAPATGKRVSVEGIDIARYQDGRMVEHWGIYDAAAMMQQLGLLPAGAPA